MFVGGVFVIICVKYFFRLYFIIFILVLDRCLFNLDKVKKDLVDKLLYKIDNIPFLIARLKIIYVVNF